MKRKKIIFICIAVCIVCTVFIFLLVKNHKTTDSISIQAGYHEEIQYGEITKINGNDMEINLLKQTEMTQSSDNEAIYRYEEIGQTMSCRILVGTPVITKLGASTTFNHLKKQDKIAILTSDDSEEISKIWIVE